MHNETFVGHVWMEVNVECFLALRRLDSLHSHSFPLISTRLNSSSSSSPLGPLPSCSGYFQTAKSLTAFTRVFSRALQPSTWRHSPFLLPLLLSPPSHNGFFRLSSPGPKKVQFTTGRFLAFSENRDEFSAQKLSVVFPRPVNVVVHRHEHDAVLKALQLNVEFVIHKLLDLWEKLRRGTPWEKFSTRPRTAHHRCCPILDVLEMRPKSPILSSTHTCADHGFSGLFSKRHNTLFPPRHNTESAKTDFHGFGSQSSCPCSRQFSFLQTLDLILRCGDHLLDHINIHVPKSRLELISAPVKVHRGQI